MTPVLKALPALIGRILLTGLALVSLTVMLLAAGGVLAAGTVGQETAPRSALRIRQLPPLVTPVPSPAATTGVSVTLAGGWEVIEVQLPTVTPTLTPTVDLPEPAATATPLGVTPARAEPQAIEPLFIGWPTGGKVTQGFGCSPFYSGIPGPDCDDAAPWFHDGVDIANLDGAPVRAALPGAVVYAGPDTGGPVCGQYRGYGLSVILDDGQGNRALYAHLSKIEVAAGQVVTPDTLVGAVGATGCASGPHLHLGLQVNGRVVDPALYVPVDDDVDER